MPAPDVAVLVPVFEEARVVGDVVRALREQVGHVVCVDDGSGDASGEVARRAGATVLRHATNLGQGAALQTAIEHALTMADVQYLVTFDADGQHRIEDALAMLELARHENVAIVFGSRFLDERTQAGFLKRLVLKTAVWVTNQSTGMRLTDAHNGLRVIRRDAATGVRLTQNRMAHASEIVLQLGRTRLPWREYPVHVLYTDYSKAKGQSLLNAINILFELTFR